MPEVNNTIAVPDIYSKLTIPNKSISLSKTEAELIYIILTQTKITKTLEVGFAFGCSAAYIIAATNSPHFTIDPHQAKHWDNLGIKNLESLKLSHHLRFQPDFSHNALPELLKKGFGFDFIFIDGDHKYDTIMNDFFYSDLLLNYGGYILLDDVHMKATQIVIHWIKTNRLDYKQVDLPTDQDYTNLAMFQKIEEDVRQWDHFEEFYQG